MENKTNELTYLDKIGISGEKIIGTLYSGVLLLICLAIVDLSGFKTIVKDMGTIVIVLMVLGAGTVIYTLYFRVIGGFFLFQIQHLFHVLLDKLSGNRGEAVTCTASYLKNLGVARVYRRSAYEALKNNFIDHQERKTVQIAHGELHVLYITFVEIFSVWLISWYVTHDNRWLFLVCSLVFLVLAIISDTLQHMVETSYFKRREAELVDYLRVCGFVK